MRAGLRVGSLFSGVAGLEMGLCAALPGAHVVWQVEQAEYPRRVLAKHYPDTDRTVTDVRCAHRHYQTPDGRTFIAGELAAVDLICGGFPCQDISFAGTGAGLEGGRSGLWFEFLRLVRELRPRWVVIENVAALRRRGLDRVLCGLAALGYDAEWATFGADDVGAPHRRKRLAIVGWHPHRVEQGPDAIGIRRAEVCAEVADTDRNGRQPDRTARQVAGEAGRGEGQGHERQRLRDAADGGGTHQRRHRQPQPRLGRALDGLPSRLDLHPWREGWERDTPRVAVKVPDRVGRLRACGNAVVPQWAYQVGLHVRRLMA